jgi:hypothetical protein
MFDKFVTCPRWARRNLALQFSTNLLLVRDGQEEILPYKDTCTYRFSVDL